MAMSEQCKKTRIHAFLCSSSFEYYSRGNIIFLNAEEYLMKFSLLNCDCGAHQTDDFNVSPVSRC